ncbi:MAG: thermonuclease family protein [Candidatus Aminicenantes bacterium]|nr:thermonuclease family protein [Candidatus Aminicenantes bacterium]
MKAKIKVLGIVCLLIFSLALSQHIWRKCIIVIDGDTILLAGNEKVRLIGVDTPETRDENRPVQYFGKEAYEFTKSLVEGKKVRLEYGTNRKDKYGRTLAYVYLEDGTFLNAEIIRQGYGYLYKAFIFKYFDKFWQYEKEAREKKIGLWATVEAPELKAADKSEDTIVYITRTGKKYHREGCSSLKKSKIPITLKEANERGYTPCALCDPPKIKK